MIQTRGIACGRKFCSNCKTWRHICDFNGQRWVGEQPSRLSAWCKACNRLDMRKRRGYRPRDFNACFRGHPWTVESTGYHNDGKRYCRICRRIRRVELRKNPEWLELHREYVRIYNEHRRRQRGVPKRQFKNRKGRVVDLPIRDNPDLPIEPFACWVEEKIEHYGGVEAFAAAAGLKDSRPVRRVVSRMEDGHPKLFVRLDTVDRVLTNEGSTLLQELYPSLYPELEQVA